MQTNKIKIPIPLQIIPATTKYSSSSQHLYLKTPSIFVSFLTRLFQKIKSLLFSIFSNNTQSKIFFRTIPALHSIISSTSILYNFHIFFTIFSIDRAIISYSSLIKLSKLRSKRKLFKLNFCRFTYANLAHDSHNRGGPPFSSIDFNDRIVLQYTISSNRQRHRFQGTMARYRDVESSSFVAYLRNHLESNHG